MTKSNFKNSYDVITIKSLRNVTKITTQFFLYLSPLQSKFLATPVAWSIIIL